MVKKVVYTSSVSAVVVNGKKHTEVLDEESWSDIDFIRNHPSMEFVASYFISKTIVEKEMLEFGEKNGLDVVTVLPSYIHGPYIVPRSPGSVYFSMAMIFGETDKYKFLTKMDYVHVDDVARHTFIFLSAKMQKEGLFVRKSASQSRNCINFYQPDILNTRC